MARYSDLSLKDRVFMTAYRFRRVDWEPGARLTQPLAQCRVAAITTAALYTADQTPFDERMRGGDYSYREISLDVDLASLRIGHRSRSFDHRGLESDKNLALPLDRFRELVEEGFIGSVNRRHFSFMGSITAPGRLLAESGPEVARLLLEDGVEAVLLTPV
jgi:D-proline reductase (dithiol) PrdB